MCIFSVWFNFLCNQRIFAVWTIFESAIREIYQRQRDYIKDDDKYSKLSDGRVDEKVKGK